MFLMECRKIWRSFLFWIFAAAVLGAYLTQFAPELTERMAKPVEGNGSYGSVVTKEPDVIRQKAVQNLVEEYLKGYYAAYPLLIYKEVFLKEDDSVRMAAILEELTGMTKEELDSFTDYEPAGFYMKEDGDGRQTGEYHEAVMPDFTPQEVSYERFLELMEQADALIGGGSSYAEKKLVLEFSTVPMDYAAAVEEYHAVVNRENIVEAYIRLYCDYMGIFLAILPVFTAAAFFDMDRRNNMGALIYSRKISSVKIVGMRYGALVFCMALPLLLTLLYTVLRLKGLYPEFDIVWQKGICLAVFWLLPELMTVIALGMVVTELVSPLLAVLVQGVWWYLSLGGNELKGAMTKWSLILRHNTLTGLHLFREEYPIFLWNRSFYLIAALALVAVEVFLFERKRKGMQKCVFGAKSLK